MKRITEEAARRRKPPLSKETSEPKPISPAVFEILTATEKSPPSSPIDRFLWKYGNRYARTINQIPLLRNIAEKQYLRLSVEKRQRDALPSPLPSEEGDLDFLGTNWYYYDFLEQTKRQGFRGRIKRLLLRSIGFHAWWQGQINKAVYQELIRQRAEFAGSDRRIEDLLNQEMGFLRSEIADRDKKVEGIQKSVEETKGSVENIKNTTIAEINQEIGQILRQLREHKLDILDQQRRVTLLLEEARKRLGEPLSPQQVENILKEEDHLFDSLYVSIEDRFRGTREDIKQRQGIYLSHIDDVNAGTEEAPILDIGCGRGEWLELLKERNYIAKGVDSNRVMVQQCHELGLDVVEVDALEFLRKQKSNTFGAITGFHIIEHLPLGNLISVFDESLRVLKPGGVVIVETPNPENLFVGAYTFHYDPTHKTPWVPEVLDLIAGQRGFCKTTILKLHPYSDFYQVDETTDPFKNRWFYSETDFALIGYKA